MSHTKGPWQRNGSHLYGPDPQRLLIAQMSYIGRGYQEESEANHALILAAPDLLEACKLGRQKLVTYTSVYSGDKELRKLLDLWDAAIAKAQGAETSVRHETENNDR